MATFTFCLIVSGDRQGTEDDLKVCLLLACWVNALICFQKQYKIATVIQFFLVGLFGYWFGCHFLTYPLFATAKLITALIMFMIESCFIEPSKISFLYYLFFFWRSPCHSKIMVDKTKYHCTFDKEGDFVPTVDKSEASAYYTTCIGYTIKNNIEGLEKQLSGIGKCHAWGVVSSCRLAVHKYLAYGVTMHARWSTWVILACALFAYVQVIIIPGTTYYYIDFLFVFWTGVDIFNCLDADLEEEYISIKANVKIPGYFYWIELLLLFLFLILARFLVPPSWCHHGFIIFITVSIICSFVLQFVCKIIGSGKVDKKA